MASGPKRSLRIRITASTAAVVFLFLSLGAVGIVVLLDRSLLNVESQAVRNQAEQIATDAEAAGRLPALEPDGVIIQLQTEGKVLAVADDDSDEPEGHVPLPVTDSDQIVLIDGDRHIVRSDCLAINGLNHHVVVARPLNSADEAVRAATVLMTVAVPVASAFVALVIWVVVGRSLHPVERIRRDVESVGDDLTRRIESPGGTDEVARLASTMNKMLDKLEASQRAQRRFVSDASHELRSPVAAIRQHTQVALLHPGATDLESLASSVDSEADRLNGLVNDLLLLARLDEGVARNRREVDLDDIVLAEADRLRALGVAVDTTRVGPARVLADEGLLVRAVRNAAENARRHARSRIEFSLSAAEGRVALCVDDDGEGVPEEDRQRIFHRFERRDDARSRDSGGAGLGLSIIAEAAQHTGGSAKMGVSPAGGARLELHLPEHPDS